VHDFRKRKEIELAEYVQANAAFVAVAIAASMKWIKKQDPTTTGVQRGLAGSRSERKLLPQGICLRLSKNDNAAEPFSPMC